MKGATMSSARLTKHVVAKMPSRVGLLADVAETIHAAGVNIMAVMAYEMDGRGEFMFLTSDNAKAAEALGRLNAEVSEETVIAVEMPNEPGSLEDAARKMAEAGINVGYVYGTAARGDGSATVVFRTSDDEKAAALL
jgi:hypothetical protein